MKSESSFSEIVPLNYKQLAGMYHVTYRTLKSWLEPFMTELGQVRGKTFTTKQVRLIFEKLGEPGTGD